jgi:hypothetical protein
MEAARSTVLAAEEKKKDEEKETEDIAKIKYCCS